MKIYNISSKIAEKHKFKAENNKILDHGVTKRLLEKYKPKHICDMENYFDVKNQKRVA